MEPMVSKLKREAYADFAKRLLEACKDSPYLPQYGERGFSKELGKIAGVGYKGAEKWIKGEGMPDMGNAVILASHLNVRFEWLMTGRGKKHLTATDDILEIREASPSYYRPPPEIMSLAEQLMRLSPELRTCIRSLIQQLPKGDT